MNPIENKPLAVPPLTSYRIKCRYGGYIMLGGMSVDDAMVQAKRSTPDPKCEDLEVWDGTQYVKVIESEAECAWVVECDDCGAKWTEVYPEGLSGSESFSSHEDPKPCDCQSQYRLVVRNFRGGSNV